MVETLEPAGLGALMALLEERKKRLAAEGLFDEARKQLLPYLPAVIGVITSPTGAVIRDILHRLADRFPRRVLVWPVKVQGESSALEVAAAIDGFNALPERGPMPRPDLLIVARGGGSLEDLWSFNEEIVVRAAAASLIPLDLRGRTRDRRDADRLRRRPARADADRRRRNGGAGARRADGRRRQLRHGARSPHGGAIRKRGEARCSRRRGRSPTPRRCLALPRQRLDHAAARLGRALRANAHVHRVGFSRIGGRLSAHLLRTHVERRHERVATLAERAGRAMDNLLDARWARCERDAQLLAAFSYRGVLARGFTLVRDKAGRPLRTAAAVTMGRHRRSTIEFSDGRVGRHAPRSSTFRADAARRTAAAARRRGGDPARAVCFARGVGAGWRHAIMLIRR